MTLRALRVGRRDRAVHDLEHAAADEDAAVADDLVARGGKDPAASDDDRRGLAKGGGRDKEQCGGSGEKAWFHHLAKATHKLRTRLLLGYVSDAQP